MKLIKQTKSDSNDLELTPIRNYDHVVEESGLISVLVPKFTEKISAGILNPLLIRLRRTPFFKAKLDEFGSETWLEINGEKNVEEISKKLEIKKHPRPSKQEEKIVQYVLEFVKKLNLETSRDKFGDILIRKPATPGKENAKTIVLQGHLDMVCEKNRGVEFDFENDPINVYID